MKFVSRTLFTATIALLAGWCLDGDAARAESPSYAMPQSVTASQKYLFFHHNYYVETKGTEGDCKYSDLLKTLAGQGHTVISEVRPKDVSVVEFSKKAAADVRKLLDAGVPPSNITVAGHSKGAVIALRVASLVGEPKVNYVIMAGCGIKALEKGYPDFSGLKGNFLSIYASSDTVAGSCSSAFAKAGEGFAGKEIALDSPAGHQLFFKPVAAWVEPVAAWLMAGK